MTIDSNNEIFDLAYAFVAQTNASLFLTGKAGTGKTTFLRYVREHVAKNMMVVAPTGARMYPICHKVFIGTNKR
jgi:tRNA A37 threonylcarbamoyladenosine biosynthesis protein TsaE